VVYVPVSRTGYFASDGAGAYKISGDDTPVPIHTRKTTAGKITTAGSRSHASRRQVRFFESLGAGVTVINIGSSLKFCLIAEGKIDIYPRFGPTSEWDTAAAQCIVEEAGGLVTDLQFRPVRYNTRDSLLNPDFLVIGDKTFDWKPYFAAVV
jgi:3'(2'), 5'-bisphosphate nucleotidase